jgi:hypothetical protein
MNGNTESQPATPQRPSPTAISNANVQTTECPGTMMEDLAFRQRFVSQRKLRALHAPAP